MDGLARLAAENWLDPLGSPLPGWPLLRHAGLDLPAQLAYLERAGIAPEAFLDAWTTAGRRMVLRPRFSGWRLSESAWQLAELRPAWREPLRQRLVSTFLRPWIQAFGDHFQGGQELIVSLQWKHAVQHLPIQEVEAWLLKGRLIPELRALTVDVGDAPTLSWPSAPPTDLIIQGGLREIRGLARPASLGLLNCPELRQIQDLDTEMLWIEGAPRLTLTEAQRQLLPDRLRTGPTCCNLPKRPRLS